MNIFETGLSQVPIGFQGQVAIVTGGGAGLGRAHAWELARRGARVVINDLGGSLGGTGSNTNAALSVAQEIIKAGGQAIANSEDISNPLGAQALVDAAMARFGRVDVLINNAGILRDKTLVKMNPDDFEAVLRVHLLGSAWCCRSAIPAMQANNYGRIVMTTSAAGLYGNYGQTNYAAAKLGIVGLMNSLKHETEKFGIKINAVAPVALTRMTEGLPLNRLLKEALPERVSAAVTYLASDRCTDSGLIVAAGAGYFSSIQIVEGQGVHAGLDNVTAEFVAHNWARITNMQNAKPFNSAMDALSINFGISPE